MLVTISIAQNLKVKPAKAAGYLKVSAGQKVRKNDLIAVRKNLFNKTLEIRSELDGTISSFSEQTGELAMEVGGQESNSVDPKKEKKDVEVNKSQPSGKNKIQAFFGFGSGTGELVVCEQCLEFSKIKKDYKGKIILAPSISTKAAFYKSSAIGAAGLVLLSMEEKETLEIQELSGENKIGFLVLEKKESKELWEKITKWKGKAVRIQGDKKSVVLISNS